MRSATRSPALVAMLLEDGCLLKLLHLVSHPKFEVSDEVFASFRALALSRRALTGATLRGCYDEFFALYHPLLQHEGYMVQRQAVKFLSQLLCDREFQGVMLPYVQEERFLQIHMNLLRDRSQTIPLDAFHVFKLFVANPQKPQAIRNILCRNRERLIRLLESFRHKQGDDAAFVQDLDVVIQVLSTLA